MLIQGDARHIGLKDRSVQTCITSPPYWAQRNYGVAGQLGLEPTPAEYVAAMVEVFREVRRVLKDNGTLWLVLGDSYSHAGRGHRDAERWPKQAGNGHFPGRVKQNTGAKPKDLLMMPARVAQALRDDGWFLRSDIIWQKRNPFPEDVHDRPARSYEHLFLLSKSETYHYDAQAIMEPAVTGGLRNKRDVWTITSEPTRGVHLAAYPKKLIEPCILAGSRSGDLVLDPFIGSGTTATVAQVLGRRWVGLDLHPDHLAGVRRGTYERARLARRFTYEEIREIMGCDDLAACA